MNVQKRNNVSDRGVVGGQPMVFAHGFGCDKNMWRLVEPHFEGRFRTVTYDHVGFGESDLSAFDPERHSSLHGYAQDLLDVCAELDLDNVIFVGHSVAAMIGVEAAVMEPERFDRLVLVGPSPRYIDDEGYVGGFSREAIDGLLDSLDRNYLGWSSAMAPAIMGNADRPALGEELTNSFCRTDPTIAAQFARVTFLSDSRDLLEKVTTPSLVLQCSEDVIAPRTVGEYTHRRIVGSEITFLEATGHCPNLSAPDETIAAIDAYLSS